MVAWTGVERLKEGLWDEPPSNPDNVEYFCEVLPKWPLGERDGKSKNLKEQISKKMKAADVQQNATNSTNTPNNGTSQSEAYTQLGSKKRVLPSADTEGLSKKMARRIKRAEYLAEKKGQKAMANDDTTADGDEKMEADDENSPAAVAEAK